MSLARQPDHIHPTHVPPAQFDAALGQESSPSLLKRLAEVGSAKPSRPSWAASKKVGRKNPGASYQVQYPEEAMVLKDLFRASGKTAVQFCKATGLNPGLVSHHRTGRDPISLLYVKEYARFFGVPLSHISPRWAAQVAAGMEGIAIDDKEVGKEAGSANEGGKEGAQDLAADLLVNLAKGTLTAELVGAVAREMYRLQSQNAALQRIVSGLKGLDAGVIESIADAIRQADEVSGGAA